MSIAIGIYDFFAYTVPGTLYLAVTLYTMSILGVVKISYTQINNVSFFTSLLIAGIAFLLGMLMDPLTKPLATLFRHKDAATYAFNKLLADHPDRAVAFTQADWPILMKRVNLASRETANSIDRHNVLNIMLRNVGLALLLFAVVLLVQYLMYRASAGYLLAAAVSMILGLIAENESARHHRRYYQSIYQAAVALDVAPTAGVHD